MMHEYTKYFKEEIGYKRLIEKLYEKYRSLGKISGIIKLNDLNKEEANSLSKLMGTNFKEHDNISISIKKIIEIMNNSKYNDFDINILVEEYLNIKLTTKKEDKKLLSQEEHNFYQKIIDNNKDEGKKWLIKTVNEKNETYNFIHQKYLKNKNELNMELNNIINALNNLPDKKTMLPVFSSIITGDPHYLDIDNNTCKLFLYALSDLRNTTLPQNRKDKIKLLSYYGIEIDNISNYVITYQLLSDNKGINYFSQNNESLILNMQNILNAKTFNGINKKVFILENPSLLTIIITKKIRASIIISGGYLNTSVYMLIEKLIKENNTIYYNGDFDPEGLIIADKLKELYNDKINLFCYDKEDFYKGYSNKTINSKRLNLLKKVKSKELLSIKNLLLENNSAGYQENNQKRIIDYIEKMNN